MIRASAPDVAEFVPGHVGTVIPASGRWLAAVYCCGVMYRAEANPAEPGVYDSPTWEAHLRASPEAQGGPA